MGVNQRAQIVMTDAEVEAFLRDGRVMTVASIGPTGHPHLVAMWYGLVDGAICLETKAKSQKAVNLRRDSTISCLIEDGDIYGAASCGRSVSASSSGTWGSTRRRSARPSS